MPFDRQQLAKLEPAHFLWWASRAALVAALVLVPVMIFSPGLFFWIDLLTVIPIMLMGGMCSEDMMTRMISTAITFGLICALFVLVRVITGRLRFTFDENALTSAWQFLTPPGPTVWQARLFGLKLSRARSRRAPRPFFTSALTH